MVSYLCIDKYIVKKKIGKGSFGEVFLASYNPDKVHLNPKKDYVDDEFKKNIGEHMTDDEIAEVPVIPNISSVETEILISKTSILKDETEEVGSDPKITVDDIPLAIKKIKGESRFFKAAQREIRYLQELNLSTGDDFPIVKLLDTFQDNLIQYLVFEYMETNLYKFYQSRFISYANTLKIFKEVTRGLEFIHSKSLVHADLKPENIMLDYNCQKIKIIDVGSSFRFRAREKRKNFYIQSRYYRAPECCFNLITSPAIDIWSLGCIIYEILFRKPLFPAKNMNSDLIYYYTIYLGIPLNHPKGYNDYFLSPKFRDFFRWNDNLNNYQIKNSSPNDLIPNSKGLIEKLNYKFFKMYSDIDAQAIKYILLEMISYDYHRRIRASEILQDKIFKNNSP